MYFLLQLGDPLHSGGIVTQPLWLDTMTSKGASKIEDFSFDMRMLVFRGISIDALCEEPLPTLALEPLAEV